MSDISPNSPKLPDALHDLVVHNNNSVFQSDGNNKPVDDTLNHVGWVFQDSIHSGTGAEKIAGANYLGVLEAMNQYALEQGNSALASSTSQAIKNTQDALVSLTGSSVAPDLAFGSQSIFGTAAVPTSSQHLGTVDIPTVPTQPIATGAVTVGVASQIVSDADSQMTKFINTYNSGSPNLGKADNEKELAASTAGLEQDITKEMQGIPSGTVQYTMLMNELGKLTSEGVTATNDQGFAGTVNQFLANPGQPIP
jgi:hypothetical protein